MPMHPAMQKFRDTLLSLEPPYTPETLALLFDEDKIPLLEATKSDSTGELSLLINNLYEFYQLGQALKESSDLKRGYEQLTQYIGAGLKTFLKPLISEHQAEDPQLALVALSETEVDHNIELLLAYSTRLVEQQSKISGDKARLALYRNGKERQKTLVELQNISLWSSLQSIDVSERESTVNLWLQAWQASQKTLTDFSPYLKVIQIKEAIEQATQKHLEALALLNGGNSPVRHPEPECSEGEGSPEYYSKLIPEIPRRKLLGMTYWGVTKGVDKVPKLDILEQGRLTVEFNTALDKDSFQRNFASKLSHLSISGWIVWSVQKSPDASIQLQCAFVQKLYADYLEQKHEQIMAELHVQKTAHEHEVLKSMAASVPLLIPDELAPCLRTTPSQIRSLSNLELLDRVSKRLSEVQTEIGLHQRVLSQLAKLEAFELEVRQIQTHNPEVTLLNDIEAVKLQKLVEKAELVVEERLASCETLQRIIAQRKILSLCIYEQESPKKKKRSSSQLQPPQTAEIITALLIKELEEQLSLQIAAYKALQPRESKASNLVTQTAGAPMKMLTYCQQILFSIPILGGKSPENRATPAMVGLSGSS